MSLCSQIHKALHDRITQLIDREASNSCALLDIGCWDSKNTSEYGAVAKSSLLAGVEVFPDQALMARQRGIDVAEVNLETDPLPWAPQTFDLVVCNQVFEHLKISSIQSMKSLGCSSLVGSLLLAFRILQAYIVA